MGDPYRSHLIYKDNNGILGIPLQGVKGLILRNTRATA